MSNSQTEFFFFQFSAMVHVSRELLNFSLCFILYEVKTYISLLILIMLLCCTYKSRRKWFVELRVGRHSLTLYFLFKDPECAGSHKFHYIYSYWGTRMFLMMKAILYLYLIVIIRIRGASDLRPKCPIIALWILISSGVKGNNTAHLTLFLQVSASCILLKSNEIHRS